MDDDDLVLARQVGHGAGDVRDLVDLGRSVRAFAPTQQGVAAQGDDDRTLTPRAWRP